VFSENGSPTTCSATGTLSASRTAAPAREVLRDSPPG
jgi:hypothetical protein